jgi:hypothetical protein
MRGIVMKGILFTAGRLLIFKATPEELHALDRRHLVFGLLCTWLVGMGRLWEDPKANLLQHLGVGSVVYIFVLALFLWLLLWPLNPPHWSLLNVLTFISLTAPPAVFYAIPVRHGLPLQTAQDVRLWLLAIVAGWRVALLGFYMRRSAGFSGLRWVLAFLFPLLFILFILTALNLEKVVFDIMGGIHPSERSVNDTAYGVLFLLTMVSELAFLPLLVTYLGCSVYALVDRLGKRVCSYIYILAFISAAAGITVLCDGQTFLGDVLVGSGIILLAANLAKLHELKNPES